MTDKQTKAVDFADWIERTGNIEEGRSFERYFFVDFENLHSAGLQGVSQLTEQDCVKLYYSEAAQHISIGIMQEIFRSPAQFEYIKVQIPIKNGADCVLLMDVHHTARQDRTASYFIVSADRDFDRSVQKFRGQHLAIRKVADLQAGIRADLRARAQAREAAEAAAVVTEQQAVMPVETQTELPQESRVVRKVAGTLARGRADSLTQSARMLRSETVQQEEQERPPQKVIQLQFPAEPQQSQKDQLTVPQEQASVQALPEQQTGRQHRKKKKKNKRDKIDRQQELFAETASAADGGQAVSIEQQETAAQSGQEDWEANVRQYFTNHFQSQAYQPVREQIMETVLQARSKQQVNNGLLKHFPSETVGKMNKELRPLLRTLPGQ